MSEIVTFPERSGSEQMGRVGFFAKIFLIAGK